MTQYTTPYPSSVTGAIHPTAIIHPQARVHPTARIGPYAVIGSDVEIGAETTIAAHAVIEGQTIIGARNQIFASAVIGTAPQDRKYDGSPSQVIIGDDNVIREFATINRATGEGEVTRLGNGNLILACAHVAHNCTLEDQIVLANGVALAGHVYIESRVTVGGVLGVHQFVRIGQLAMIGGMSRIDRDVPPFMLAEGHPGRVRALNKIGLKRAGYGEGAGEESGLVRLQKAFRLLYRSGLTLDQSLEALADLASPTIADDPLLALHTFLERSRAGRRGPMPGRQHRSITSED